MSIPVTCPGCKKSFKVDDKFAGKTGPCPHCKAKITVPEKPPEIKVHAPEEFVSGGKSVSGAVLLKPIARKETRLKPLTLAIIGGVAVAAIIYALLVRAIAPMPAATGATDNKFVLRTILCGLGALLIAPPLAVAAYTFLRDDDLEPNRGMELWIRAAACGAIYAILWGVFAYIRVGVFATDPITLPMWLVVAPPFFIVGGVAGKFAFDLETSNGFFHYAFYVAVTILLGMIAGVSPGIWS